MPETTEQYKEKVKITLTVNKSTFKLLKEVQNKSGANSQQEIIRAALNYYFVTHGYKVS